MAGLGDAPATRARHPLDRRYVVHCRTGRRSDLAAQQMAAAGSTHITDAGGLADLARAGAPVE